MNLYDTYAFVPQGFLFPVCQSLIAKWAPSSVKIKFMSSLSGGALGTAITWPLCGFIIEILGWPSVFYTLVYFRLCLPVFGS